MLGITPRKGNVNIGPRINKIKKNCRNRNKKVRIVDEAKGCLDGKP